MKTFAALVKLTAVVLPCTTRENEKVFASLEPLSGWTG